MVSNIKTYRKKKKKIRNSEVHRFALVNISYYLRKPQMYNKTVISAGLQQL